MNRISFASKPEAPWVVVTSEQVSKSDLVGDILVVELDAKLMTGLEGLYRELKFAFKFPDYFGDNFNALDECLSDLGWLPASCYLVIINNSEFLLRDESDEVFSGFISILHDAGAEWAEPIALGESWDREAIPFHTLLVVSQGGESVISSRLGSVLVNR